MLPLGREPGALGDGEAGAVEVMGSPVQACGRLATDIRRTRARVGFVFQQFNLVGRLPVMTNVLTGTLGRVPLWRSLTGTFTRAERELALDALDRVGIADKAWVRASALSGGQQQRAAIARTLVQQADIILADEPIASLDPKSAKRVMDTLVTMSRDHGIALVVSLHQVDYATAYFDRVVAMNAGRVVFDGPASQINAAFLTELYGASAEELILPSQFAVTVPPETGALAESHSSQTVS